MKIRFFGRLFFAERGERKSSIFRSPVIFHLHKHLELNFHVKKNMFKNETRHHAILKHTAW
jgi:hypothetical protein